MMRALRRVTASHAEASSRVPHGGHREDAPARATAWVYEPGDYCPASVAMTHEELNKDKSTNVGRGAQFVAAKSLATAQSRHEWCRISAIVAAAWGDPGTAELSTWVADGAAPPDCSRE